MKNVDIRARIATFFLGIHAIPTFCMVAFTRASAKPIRGLVARVRKKNAKKIETWLLARADFERRADALKSEVQHFAAMSDIRKAEIRAACAALKADVGSYEESVSMGLPASVSFIESYLQFIQGKLEERGRKTLAFERLISKIDSDTFYLDLLLWFMLPDAFSEVLMGDLTEEFVIRRDADGVEVAKAWYRQQVTTTLRDCIWKKVERLAALGTLIDLLFRSHKK